MSEPRPSPRPVSLEALNAAADAEFVRALDGIFEHAAWVAEGAASRRPFPGLRALHDALLQVVAESGEARQLALIRNHPELAGRAAAERKLTAESAGEQSFGNAQTVPAMEAVVRNTFIQGTLSIVFVTLAIIVIITAILATIKAFRNGGGIETEDDAVASRTYAPAGLIATPAEKELESQWAGLEANKRPARSTH